MEQMQKFENKCPRCSSEQIEYDVIEIQDDGATQLCGCKQCSFQFRIWTDFEWVIA